MENEKDYCESISPEIFNKWFIEDFGNGTEFTKIELVKKNFTHNWSDETKSEYSSIYIKIEAKIKQSFILNRTGYFRVHYIDFSERKAIGFIYIENFKDVLADYSNFKDNHKLVLS